MGTLSKEKVLIAQPASPLGFHRTYPARNRPAAVSINPCDPIEQQARQDRLEAAYLADERSQTPGHPLAWTYTGLLTDAADGPAQ